MKKHTRFTAFFLAMVMILSMFTTMASAEEGEIESETNSQTETSETDNTLTLQPITAEDFESFDVLKAPDIISTAEIQKNGYVGRVRNQEKDLYTLVFKNSNGSYTKKIYSHPVKYVDSTGVVRDISLEIGENKDGSFSTASHEIITTFKKNPVNGITLDYKDVSIRMVPALTGNKAPAAIRSADNKKITYNLDSTTAYVYELTYAGYKEDIVVKKYTGQTEYMFKLYTNGLTLTKINETYCLTDSEGEIKATVGDVIIFTADERNNTFGSMTYQTVRQNQEYIITIHVDADYLKDPKTVYPIRIDPTVEIKYENNGSGAIEDVTINSNAGSDGSSTSLLIGKRNTYGISRVLLRVPELDFTGVPYAASITSATISLRDIMCESTALDIYCHQFNGGYWAESTVSWSSINANGYNSTPLSSNTISYSNGLAVGQRYTFDITDAVWDWFSDGGLKDMGLIFKASSTVENASAHNHRTFGSYNKSSYRPVFTMVYDMYTSITIHPVSMSLTEGQTSQLIASSSLPDATITWTVSDPSIASYNSATNKVTALKAGTTTITATATVPAGSYSTSCTVNVYLPDGVYYIKNMNSNLYLHAKNSGTVSYTDVIQYSKYESNDDDIIDRLSQMWKIHHVGNGIYTVRPMHYPNAALDVSSSNNVDIQTISDDDIVDKIKWTISWNSTGYVFKNNGTNSKTMQIENASTSSSASVKASTYSSTSANCRWEITAAQAVALYDTSNGKAISSTNKEYVAPEETRTLSQFSLDAEYFSGTTTSQTFTWSSSNTAIAKVNSSTGAVTGVSPGTATITVTKNSLTTSYTIVVTIAINQTTYLLKNKQTEFYADVNDQAPSNGDNIWLKELHIGTSQQWTFTHIGDGYYTITPKTSNSLALWVASNSSNLNAGLALRSTSQGIQEGMKWRIETTASGAVKLIPKTGESSGYVLSALGSSEESYLVQGEYRADNGSYLDEWNLIRMLPVSGDELDFDSSLWLGDDISAADCYPYAINNQVDDWGYVKFYDVGEYSNNEIEPDEILEENRNKIIAAIQADFNNFNPNFVCEKVDKYEVCPAGTYKIAVAIYEKHDYHFYRQNSDGFWSHKLNSNSGLGANGLMNADHAGKVIVDPAEANRGEYTVFIGYLAITPWNRYYTGSN